MPQNSRNLSYHELVTLLRRSTAAQNRRDDREFIQQDLLDIAAQVGISADVVRQVVDEHFRKRSELEMVPRPFDTKIRLSAYPDSFELVIPPLGFSGGALFGIVFSIAWLGFVSFWTFFAAQGSLLFALFSLPFWVVGLGMIRSHIGKHFSVTTLHLDRERGTLVQRPFGRRRELRTGELNVTLTTSKPGMNSRNNTTGPAQVLRLHHGVKSYDLMEGYSDGEQRWVESELRGWLL